MMKKKNGEEGTSKLDETKNEIVGMLISLIYSDKRLNLRLSHR